MGVYKVFRDPRGGRSRLIDHVILMNINIRWQDVSSLISLPWASYQIRKIAGCACAGNAAETFSPPLRTSDPDMHHGTCVTHVPWCMPGSLTSGFLWSRWRGKRSRHSWHMHNLQFYASGKRPMVWRYVYVMETALPSVQIMAWHILGTRPPSTHIMTYP